MEGFPHDVLTTPRLIGRPYFSLLSAPLSHKKTKKKEGETPPGHDTHLDVYDKNQKEEFIRFTVLQLSERVIGRGSPRYDSVT